MSSASAQRRSSRGPARRKAAELVGKGHAVGGCWCRCGNAGQRDEHHRGEGSTWRATAPTSPNTGHQSLPLVAPIRPTTLFSGADADQTRLHPSKPAAALAPHQTAYAILRLGYLEAGAIVLRDALGILRVLRLLTGIHGPGLPTGVEG